MYSIVQAFTFTDGYRCTNTTIFTIERKTPLHEFCKSRDTPVDIVSQHPSVGQSRSTNRKPNEQVRLKEATASFKKGDMGAREYHESILTRAFGDELPKMLPEILKALPPDRAAALVAVSHVYR